jgi:hypothetical protein
MIIAFASFGVRCIGRKVAFASVSGTSSSVRTHIPDLVFREVLTRRGLLGVSYTDKQNRKERDNDPRTKLGFRSIHGWLV